VSEGVKRIEPTHKAVENWYEGRIEYALEAASKDATAPAAVAQVFSNAVGAIFEELVDDEGLPDSAKLMTRVNDFKPTTNGPLVWVGSWTTDRTIRAVGYTKGVVVAIKVSVVGSERAEVMAWAEDHKLAAKIADEVLGVFETVKEKKA